MVMQGACSKASGSVPSIRRDATGGVGAECSPVSSAIDRRSVRTWSAVDKATETEQEDTENDDVPLTGLLHCSRREADNAQVGWGPIDKISYDKLRKNLG